MWAKCFSVQKENSVTQQMLANPLGRGGLRHSSVLLASLILCVPSCASVFSLNPGQGIGRQSARAMGQSHRVPRCSSLTPANHFFLPPLFFLPSFSLPASISPSFSHSLLPPLFPLPPNKHLLNTYNKPDIVLSTWGTPSVFFLLLPLRASYVLPVLSKSWVAKGEIADSPPLHVSQQKNFPTVAFSFSHDCSWFAIRQKLFRKILFRFFARAVRNNKITC